MLLETAPVMFFGGKGGVGKTTVSAATAVRLAETGRRVLLVSTDPAHNLGHIWSVSLSDTPTELEPGLSVVELDPTTTTERHLADVEQSMRAMMPERMHPEIRRHLDLSRNSPGMHEAAMLERVAELVDTQGVDHIIFDTAPSGHTSRLLALPELMAAYTGGLMQRREQSDKFSRALRGLGGADEDPVQRRNQQIRTTLLRRRRKFERLRDILTDPARCTFTIVLTAERLPVLESTELYDDLTQHHIRVSGLVVNRRSPADAAADGTGAGAGAGSSASEFLAARRAVEDEALALLDAKLPNVPRVELPWLPGEIGTRAEDEYGEK